MDAHQPLALEGLQGPVELLRDEWGIPHVQATSRQDAFFGQAFATAQDRLWQMDWDRRQAAGTCAAVVGEKLLAQDLLVRRMDLVGSARRDLAAADPVTRGMLEAYAAGVNAWLSQGDLAPEFNLIGAPPPVWEAWHCLAVFKVRHALMGSFPAKLWRGRVVARLGAQRAARLFPEAPEEGLVILPPGARAAPGALALDDLLSQLEPALAWLGNADSGSNSWALSGDRTASGKPLLAGDPHRPLEVPGVYYQNHIACPEFDAVGLSFPGVPGMPHFGHNQQVAWCVTHACADYQDLYVEQLRRDGDQVEYRSAAGWRPARSSVESVTVWGAATHEVLRLATERGPLVAGGPEQGWGLSLRYTATDGANSAWQALWGMLETDSAAEMDAAMGCWVDPCNNFVMADAGGTIRYLHRGQVPVRSAAAGWVPVPGWEDQHSWRGMVPFDQMPRVVDPPDGRIVTANNRILGADFPHYLGRDYAPEHRARRLSEGLARLGPATVSDMPALHGDDVSLPARVYRDAIGRLDLPPGPLRQAQGLLSAWDGAMQPQSAAAALYSALRSALDRHVIGELLGPLAAAAFADRGRGASLHVAVLSQRLVADAAAGRIDLLPAGTGWAQVLGAALKSGVAALSERLGTDSADWRWGALHQLAPVHPLATRFTEFGARANPPVLELGGDGDTPRAAGHQRATDFAVTAISVARYVFDLADWEASRWIVPLGASGVPGTPHFADQQTYWAALQTIPMRYVWHGIRDNAASHQLLQPPQG